MVNKSNSFRSQDNRELPGRRLPKWGLPVLVGACGFAASVFAFVVVNMADMRRVHAELELRTEWRTREVILQIERAMDPAKAVAVYIAAIEPIDQHGFRRVARQAKEPEDPVRGLFWLPRVKRDRRDDLVKAVRNGGDPGFQLLERVPDGRLIEAGDRDEYFPILFEQTFENQHSMRGVTIENDPLLHAAATRARDEGRPIATPPFRFGMLPRSDPLFLIFWPVYAGGQVPATTAERQNLLRGFIMASYRLQAVFAATAKNTPDIIESIRFFVGSEPAEAAPPRSEVVRYSPKTRTVSSPADDDSGSIGPGAIRLERRFEQLGQSWALMFEFPREAVAAAHSGARWGLLIAGLLLTVIVGAHLWRERLRARAIEAVVASRTAALRSANRSLHREITGRESAQATLRETTDTLRAIIQGSPLAVIAIDPDRTVRIWNRAADRMFGYGAEEVVGRAFPLIPLEGEAAFQELFERACAGETLRDIDVRHRRKDGVIINVRLSGAAFYDAADRLRGVVYSLDDVTDRLTTEAVGRQAQKMEAIGTLTGGMAHDFNNLLAVIIGNLDLLEDDLRDNDKAVEKADAALRAALRGAELTRRLLAFSRRQPLQASRLDVNELVTGMIKLLGRTLGEQVTIQLITAHDLWPVVADASQLEAAVANLALNARDAMPDGGALIIKTRNFSLDAADAARHRDMPAGDYVLLEVSDTGVGMSPQVQARIFEPFFTTKTEGRGTGLGLSMVYGFVKQSGGQINVYSEEGKGTTFRLYLPSVMAAADAQPERLTVTAPAPKCDKRILVVDDNGEVRRVVLEQLGELGYRTLEAARGEEALSILDRGEAVDLLFTDVVMPGGMSGVKLADAARERRPELRLLFTSGFPAEATHPEMMLASGGRLLSKPYRKEDLARELNRIWAEA